MDQNCINRLPRQAAAGSWSDRLKCTLVSVGTSVILRIHHIMPRREKKRSNHEARKPRGRYCAGLAEKPPLMRWLGGSVADATCVETVGKSWWKSSNHSRKNR